MNNLTKKGYRGYCTHNQFGHYKIPVPIQNLMYRDYTARNGMLFKLSTNELFFPNCYINMGILLEELPSLEGILMASIFMLPKNIDDRYKIYASIIKENSSIHFVMENLILNSLSSQDYIENIFLLSETIQHSPKSINPELLTDLTRKEFFTSL